MTHPLASLLVPRLSWDPGHGFGYLDEAIEDALDLGVGGFLLTGGTCDAVSELTKELHRRSREPLLIAADAEAGAGSAFVGATGLPPLAALGALRDTDAIRRTAKLTARELRTLGVNWVLGPVADLERSPLNPVQGSRSLGADAQRVAEWVVEWVDACQGEAVLACVKHYPGIGRLTTDPCLGVATADVPAAELWADDLLPFRGAVDTGVASLMAASAAFPRLDPSGSLASCSRPLISELLRSELRFDGLVVAELPGSSSRAAAHDESLAAVHSIAAGCDLLLAPSDIDAVLAALDAGIDAGVLSLEALDATRHRRAFWAEWARPFPGREPTLDEVLWARQVADTVVHAVRGVLPSVGPVVDVIRVDDDASAWDPPPGGPFIETLRALGMQPHFVAGPTDEGRGSVVLAVFGGPGPGKGRAGYSADTRRRVAQGVADARQAKRSAVVVVFGPPRLAAELPEAGNVVCAWSGARAMQEAAARRLA